MSSNEFAILDWEHDPVLNDPTPLDFRINEMMEKTTETVNNQSNYSTDISEAVFSDISTPSVASTSSSTPEPLKIVEKPTEVPVDKQSSNKTARKITLQEALARSASEMTTSSATAVKPTAKPALTSHVTSDWAPPAAKIRKYEDRKSRFEAHRAAYLDKFKSMKNIFRKIKCTDEALPPSAETIQLFDEVKFIIVDIL